VSTEICGARLSEDHWNCILDPGHEEPWHVTFFGHSWVGDDPATYRVGFPPLPGETAERSSIHAEEAGLAAEVTELREILAKVENDQCGCLGGPLTIEWARGL
jgi:hypothetical protein